VGVTYHYWRNLSQYSEEIASLPEALARARHDVEYQEAAPSKIVLEDGAELDDEEIMERSGYNADVTVRGLIIDSTATRLD
jgi:hypothetical protein